MELMVKSFAPDSELKKATAQLNSLAETIKTYKVSLSNESRKNMRVVGSSRMGLVEITDRIATQYDAKLPKTEKSADLSERIAYLHTLRAYRLAAKNLCEILDDTEKALGKDIMAYVDKFSSSLQSARKYDGDMDEAMKELDDYNARFGKIIEEEDKENETDGANNETPTE